MEPAVTEAYMEAAQIQVAVMEAADTPKPIWLPAVM